MTIYQESLQDNKPLHSITFRITPYAQEPTLLSKWSLLRHLDRQSRTTLRAVFRVVLAPWHIRSEKSMDFANGCAKESAQAQLLGISKQRVSQYIGEQRLPAFQAGNVILLPVEAFKQFKPHITGRSRTKEPWWRTSRGGVPYLAPTSR